MLIAEAGPSAQNVVHHRGWLNCFRTEESLDQAIADAQRLDDYGVDYVVLSTAQLRALEPHVSERVIGAIHFRGSPSASDPGMLTKAYADLFTRKGGRFIRGDARRLASDPSGWSVTTEMMSIEAREAVVALGPWSDERRPPRLDLTVYPYLPRATVALTSAKAYLDLLTGVSS